MPHIVYLRKAGERIPPQKPVWNAKTRHLPQLIFADMNSDSDVSVVGFRTGVGVDMETVWLQRPSGDIPWGFRLHGGSDFRQPLSVQRVSEGSIASTQLNKGDVIVAIGDNPTEDLTHIDAQDLIKAFGNVVQLTVLRGGGLIPSPISPMAFTHHNGPGLTNGTDVTNMSPGGVGGPPAPPPPPPPPPMGVPPMPGAWRKDYNETQHSPSSSSSGGFVPDNLVSAMNRKDGKTPFTYTPGRPLDLSESEVLQRKNLRRQHKLQKEQLQQGEPKASHSQKVLENVLQGRPVQPPRQVPQTTPVPTSPAGIITSKTLAACEAPSTPVQKDYTESDVYKMVHGKLPPSTPYQHTPVTPPRHQEEEELSLDSSAKKQGLSFQVLQWLTDTDKDEGDTTTPLRKAHPVERKMQRNLSHNAEDDEMSFSGIRDKSKDIPSKTFKYLQKMTSLDESDNPAFASMPAHNMTAPVTQVKQSHPKTPTSPPMVNQSNHPLQQNTYPVNTAQQVYPQEYPIQEISMPHQNVAPLDNQDDGTSPVGDYEESSIRYRGKHIPSRSFKLLQEMTGGPRPEDTDPQQNTLQRRQRINPPTHHQPVSLYSQPATQNQNQPVTPSSPYSQQSPYFAQQTPPYTQQTPTYTPQTPTYPQLQTPVPQQQSPQPQATNKYPTYNRQQVTIQHQQKPVPVSPPIWTDNKSSARSFISNAVDRQQSQTEATSPPLQPARQAIRVVNISRQPQSQITSGTRIPITVTHNTTNVTSRSPGLKIVMRHMADDFDDMSFDDRPQSPPHGWESRAIRILEKRTPTGFDGMSDF